MVVQHNLTAMNSNRMLGLTTAQQAKSTEKLSSGYKINRAADDAAGLSISEKMRKQMRGLTQASANAQDGISAVQTAEGALNEVQDMLQRMNELAVKAGNGTMSEDDRDYVQNEIDQLIKEIDRVSETTKFNETYLLKGNSNTNGNAVTKTATGDKEAIGAKPLNGIEFVIVAKDAKATITDGDKASLTVGIIADDSDKVTNVTDAAEDVKEVTKEADDTYTVTKTDGSVIKGLDETKLKDDYGITADDGEFAQGDKVTISKTLNGTNPFGQDTAVQGSYNGSARVGETVDVYAAVDREGNVTFSESAKALVLSFQVGADTTSENKIDVTMESMSAASLGINGLKVDGSNSANADAAVETIADAIQKVSEQRSALGAVQNRLEHTINNLNNVVENTTAAESQIRDTDMASEMVKYSNNNILAQAGQAMLAQANQSNQGVLSLLD